MNFPMPDFSLALPEMFLLAAACFVLVVDLFVTDPQRRVTYVLTLISIAGAAVLSYHGLNDGRSVTFTGTFVADRLADTLKLFTYLTVGVVLVYAREYLQDRLLVRGEYYILTLFALLGIMVMISAHHFLTVYLGLELLSLSLYALVASDRDSPVAAEAAMKYFVLGAIASGTLLYGISILYGATGTLNLGELTAVLAAMPDTGTNLPVLLGLVFVLVGLAFKLGAVPFHMWVPDVYHGAPTSVTLFIGTASKLAAFALLARVLFEGMGPLHDAWKDMVAVLAALSMLVGNFVAIAQTNLKRMLAYSTISHVGFILLGFLPGTAAGVQASLFYTLAYVIMAAAAFGMIILLGREGFEADELADFKGLAKRSPWYALVMLMVMVSMAGVPPFVGFWAKLAVIQATLAANFTGLAILAVLTSVVGAFYYLRVIKLMYFDAADEGTELPPIRAGIGMHVVLSANGLAILVLGLFPAVLVQICARALGNG
ncbi:MAG: NADH-quinone oxidoreductase subunit NuoN [Xanthomonadales bacterium]|nr:NADH-quinone oxidoreductase subunit NuoN [Xanthomonadales bacterium]